jgi:hypothetical protein
MYAGLSQTLESFKTRPLTTRRNISEASMPQVLAALKPFSKGVADIHEDTILFYLHSHAQHLIEARRDLTEALPADEAKLLEAGYRDRSQIAMRMFYYMLRITGEEGHYGRARSEEFFDYIEEQTSPEATEWLRNLLGGNAEHIPTSETIKLGDAVRAVMGAFDYAGWSSSFGGARWSAISQALHDAVRGKSTLELMVDNALTLCHNNGAIFNKGHNYTRYEQGFYDILDIQACGQIPALIAQGSGAPGITPRVKAAWAQYAQQFPEEFNVKLDRSKVSASTSARRAKEEQLQKKAQAKNATNAAPSAIPKGPPKRTSDDLDNMMASSLGLGMDFDSMVKKAGAKMGKGGGFGL